MSSTKDDPSALGLVKTLEHGRRGKTANPNLFDHPFPFKQVRISSLSLRMFMSQSFKVLLGRFTLPTPLKRDGSTFCYFLTTLTCLLPFQNLRTAHSVLCPAFMFMGLLEYDGKLVQWLETSFYHVHGNHAMQSICVDFKDCHPIYLVYFSSNPYFNIMRFISL